VTPLSDLLSPAGQELLGLLGGQEISPDLALRLAGELRGRYSPDLVAAALTQQSLRMAGRAKFSRADAMFFTRAGLEQASSEMTATHSARRLAGLGPIADLCCGIGGNLAALAAVAGPVLAVDADLQTLEFARWNAAVYDQADGVTPVCADVRDLALPGGGRFRVGAVFIDPARRSGERRFRAGEGEPPLDWCFGLADGVGQVAIKAAPGLPHELVPAGWEIEFVAAGRNLKEALLWSPALATTPRRATILPASLTSGSPGGDHTMTSEPGAEVPVAAPGEYLLDPNPAVTRAGLVQELARSVGAWKIDPMIAFLAADVPISTPFARTLRVLESMPWNERQVARRLRELSIGTADIRRRGLAGDVAQIHRRLALQGDGSATIVLTRRSGKPWGLICTPVQDPAS
jgi:THUMP domain-containing protein/RNA cap guanine-N2 methyltransferase